MAQPISYGDPYSIDEAEIQRRQAFAKALQDQSMQPLETNQMAGGWVVPVSPFQGLAKMGQAYFGRKGEDKATEMARALQERKQNEYRGEMSQFAELLKGRAANNDVMQSNQSMDSFDPTPAVAGDKNKALAMALGAKNPMLNQIGMQEIMQANKPMVVGRSLVTPEGKTLATDSTWQAEQQAAREAKQAELQAKMEDARTSRQERADAQRQLAEMNIAARRDMAQLAAGLRQPPAPHPVTVIDDKGNSIVKDARSGQVYGRAPGDAKLEGAFNQDTAALQGSTNSFDRLAQAANEAMSHPGLKGVTGLRGAIPNIPGTAAADAQAKLNTLKSQVGFGVLQDMRNNSKTGGALGSVSDAEGKRLEANLAALENAQSYEQMRESLKKIVDYTEGAKDRLRSAYNMKHNNRLQTSPTASPPAAPQGGPKFLGFE